MSSRTLLILLVGIALAPGAASSAQRQVEHRGDVAANARIEISNAAGTVRVTGWDRDEVLVRATLADGVAELSFENDHDEVQIEVDLPRRRRGQQRPDTGGTELDISVPHGALLEIEALAASVAVEGVDGEIHVETSAGDITVAGGARRIEADSAAGDIEINATGEGAVIDAEVLAGSVLVQFIDARVSVTTVTADARIIGGRLHDGDFESTSGTLYFEGAIAAGADIGFENFNGDIELLIPEDSGAAFDISSYSGAIETEFGYQGQREEDFSPEQRAEFTLGNGGASIDIETFAGSVRVRKR